MAGAFGAVFLLHKFVFRQRGKIRYKGLNSVFGSPGVNDYGA